MPYDDREVQVLRARQAGCAVSLCEHDVLHVRVGAVTVHLTREAFADLCGVVLQARQRLAAERGRTCATLLT